LGARGVTAAAVITFAEHLEDRSVLFYERLSEQFPAHADLFRGFAKEDRSSKVLIVRTYQETVTDALETGFSFEGLDLDGVVEEDLWSDHPDLPRAIESAVALERAASGFYAEAAERSKTLLSTIYMAFRKIRTVREKRLAQLGSLRG
jgi:hypothetical protein